MPANPASVELTTEDAAAARATFRAGSDLVLATSASDGTRYTLAVPAEAIAGQPDLVMTPLATVNGLPGTPSVRGVQLLPEGLRLWRGATLTVEPVGATPTAVLGLMTDGQGRELHQVPATIVDGAVSMPIWHFSAPIVVIDPSPELEQAVTPIVPTDPWQQFPDRAWPVYRAQVGATPEQAAALAAELEVIFGDFYRSVVEPGFAAAEASCRQAAHFYPRALEWVHWLQVMGVEGLDDAAAAVQESHTRGMTRCLDDLAVTCLDPADADLYDAVVHFTQLLQFAGVERSLPPLCTSCASLANVPSWSGHVRYEINASAEGAFDEHHAVRATLRQSGEIAIVLAERDSSSAAAGFVTWHGSVSGTGTVDDLRVHERPAETTTHAVVGSGAVAPTSPGARPVTFRLQPMRRAGSECGLSLELHVHSPAAATYTTTTPTGTFRETVATLFTFRLHDQPFVPTPGKAAFEGSDRLVLGAPIPADASDPEDFRLAATANPGSAASIIREFAPDALVIDVEWSLEGAPPEQPSPPATPGSP
jgi:hypothetical protein